MSDLLSANTSSLLSGRQASFSYARVVEQRQPSSLAKEIMRYQAMMETERVYQDAVWDVIDDRVSNRRARWDIGTRANGMTASPMGTNIYDNAAGRAINDFCGGWQAQSCNAYVGWWIANFDGKQFKNNSRVRQWLDNVQEVVSGLMAEGNFYEEDLTAKKDGFTQGLSTMIGPEWDEDGDRLWCQVRHPREIFIQADARNRIIRWHRKYVVRGADLLLEYPDKLTQDVKRVIDDQPFRRWVCVESIHRREDRDRTSSLARDLPWARIVVLTDPLTVLHEGGLRSIDLPDTWRWDHDVSLAYPTSPVIDALEDIKGNNAAMKSKLMADQISVRPPLLASKAMKGKLHIRPDGTTFLENPTDKVEVLGYPSNFRVAMQDIADMRNGIREQFHADLFEVQTKVTNKITAMQASLIQGEKAAQLIPFTARENADLLIPKIHKYFRRAAERGKIEPPPPELQQAGERPLVKIGIVGPIETAARRHLSTDGYRAFMGALEEMIQVAPAVVQQIGLDFSPEDLRKWLLDGTNTPDRIFKSDEQIARETAQRMAEAAAAKKQQALESLAQSYNQAKDAPQAGSPAKQMMGGGQ